MPVRPLRAPVACKMARPGSGLRLWRPNSGQIVGWARRSSPSPPSPPPRRPVSHRHRDRRGRHSRRRTAACGRHRRQHRRPQRRRHRCRRCRRRRARGGRVGGREGTARGAWAGGSRGRFGSIWPVTFVFWLVCLRRLEYISYCVNKMRECPKIKCVIVPYIEYCLGGPRAGGVLRVVVTRPQRRASASTRQISGSPSTVRSQTTCGMLRVPNLST